MDGTDTDMDMEVLHVFFAFAFDQRWDLIFD